MLGPPASGKGTQGERVARALGVPHVSTGDLLRATIADGDPHGVVDIVQRGDRVPEEIVEKLLVPALGDGFVLDGFPRSAEQAAWLDDALAEAGRPLDAVFELKLDEETLAARMGLRAKEEHRIDDRPEVFVHRLETYRRDAGPIRRHYGRALITVDGHGDEHEVFRRIMAALGA